jgi:hypothetical protein
MDGVGWLHRIPRADIDHSEVPTCTQRVDAALADPASTVSAMSPTPIYDLLRGERINAEVPAADVGPPLVEHGGKHRLPVGALTAVAGFDEPPGAVADRAAGGSWFVPVNPATPFAVSTRCRGESAAEARGGGQTHPAGQQGGSGPGQPPAWGPQAALPPAAHAREEQAPGASSPVVHSSGHRLSRPQPVRPR